MRTFKIHSASAKLFNRGAHASSRAVLCVPQSAQSFADEVTTIDASSARRRLKHAGRARSPQNGTKLITLLCSLGLSTTAFAEDRTPDRKELWVPSQHLEEVLKEHPNAVLLDRAQYEALIKDAGKVKPEDQEKPPVGAVITGAKLEAQLTPGATQVTTKGVLHVTSLTDQWTELPPLKWNRGTILTSITGDHIIVQNGDAKNDQVRIAVKGQGPHDIAVEFQSSVNRRNGYCYAFIPVPLRPLSLTARVENGVHLAGDWPVHEGVAMIPSESGGSAYVLWTESADKNRKEDFTLLQTTKAVTLLEGSELTTHLQVHVQSMSNPMRQTLSFQLSDAEVNVVNLEGYGIASWKQSGALLEVKLDPASQVFRADFTALLNRSAPAMEKPTDITIDVPRLEGAPHISVHSAIRVGVGFEMLGYQTPGDAKDADTPAFEKYAASFGTLSAKANYAQLPAKIAVKIRRLSDHFSADVDNLVTLSTHEMMMQRTIAVHGEEGRVNKVELTVPVNEQFIGLSAAAGEPVEWKQTITQDKGTTLEVTWPKGLQQGQSTALWLATRQELPTSLTADSAKPNASGAKFTINNVLLPAATRLSGYVALDFDESWKVTTPEMSGLESRDARVTPVKGQMAWFTLRDYKLGIELARNEPVLDAAVIAYALPRAKQVEIEGQFTLTVSRAPLRKFDVKLPIASAKLLRVDSPLISEQQLDEATGVWHFTLRKELQGTSNVRWRLNEKTEAPNSEDSKFKIQDSKLVAMLPSFEFPTARRFSGEWVIEANTDTELSYETKGVQPLDSVHVPAVEAYQPRHRVLAAFGYGVTPHEVKITATRHEASALISAVVEQMTLTSVLSSDGSSRHEAALIVKHNGQQFFGLRLPKGAALLSAAVAGNAVKPVRAGDDEVRVPLSGSSAQSGSIAVKFVYELSGSVWGGSGKQQLEPPSVGESVPVLSTNWRVYAPEGMEYQTTSGLTVVNEREGMPPLLWTLAEATGIIETCSVHENKVDFLPSGGTPAILRNAGFADEASSQMALEIENKKRSLMDAPTVTTRSGQRAQVEVLRATSFGDDDGQKNGRKSGLIALDLTLPTTGRIIEFSGHQKPEAWTLSYQSWERQMFKAVLWMLLGAALFLRWGRSRAWMKTFVLGLLLTCIPLIMAPTWLAFCNALLAGWLMAFGGWVLLGIAKWVEVRAASLGFRVSNLNEEVA